MQSLLRAGILLLSLCSLFSISAQTSLKQSPMAISPLDSILNISPYTELYIDKPPLELPNEILEVKFGPFRNIDFHDSIMARVDQRFWYKFTLRNVSEHNDLNGDLYFGKLDRLFIYELENGSIINHSKKGFLYKNEVQEPDDHYLFYSVLLKPKESKTFLAQVSSGSYFLNNNQYCDIQWLSPNQKLKLVPRSPKETRQGILLISLLVFILLFGVLSIGFYFIVKNKSLLAFSWICLFSFVTYLREAEFYFNQIILWLKWDELFFSSVFISKSSIVIGFYLYSYYRFPQLLGKRFFKVVFIIGIVSTLVSGILALGTGHPFKSIGLIHTLVYVFDAINSICSLYLMYLLWTLKVKYSKLTVMSCLFYLLIGYTGFAISLQNPGIGETLFGYRFLSLYGLIIFLASLAYITYVEIYKQHNSLLQESVHARNLESLNEARDNLYTNITHEFRTPLTIINGVTRQLNLEKEKEDVILRNSEGLLKLVDQMLNISKLKSNSLPVYKSSFDLIANLKMWTESFSSLAREKDISLNFYSEEEQLYIYSDRDKIKMIMNNLISNSIKYTQEYGQVLVVCKALDDEIKVSVKDNGYGMNANEQSQAFDRYYRVSDDFNIGTGIGLSVVKELSNLIEGTITVESVPNEGSIFLLNFPLVRAQILPSSQRELATEEISPKSDYLDKPSILLIEDNFDLINYITQLLESKFEVISAYNGEEGIIAAENKIPDLIISDVMMPGISGIQVCHSLKSNIKTSHIPIIMLTAKANKSSKLEGINMGADAYITKPFDEDELLARIDNLLLNRKNLQDYYQSNNALPKAQNQENEFIEKAKSIVLENLSSESFSTGDLCQKLFLERTQVYRKLKALTGFSPSQLIREMRLDQSYDILSKENTTVAEACYACGFKDLSYFSKVFKQKYGVKPSEVKAKV